MNIFNRKDFLLFLLVVIAVCETVYIGAINYKLPTSKVLSETIVAPTGSITTPPPFESVTNEPELLAVSTPQELVTLTPSPTLQKTTSAIPTASGVKTPTATPRALQTTIPTFTPMPSITPSPSPTPSASPSPVSTLIPTIQRASSQEINSFIDRFAAQYSVDANVLRHIALCESGFNPMAIHLSYYGLFQFGPSTWENIRIKMGEDKDTNLRLNAEEAVQTAAYKISIGGIDIWPNCKP